MKSIRETAEEIAAPTIGKVAPGRLTRERPMPDVKGESEQQCPDCGCFVRDHNAVNRAGDKVIAHCGMCGACWTTHGTEFVELVRIALERENDED